MFVCILLAAWLPFKSTERGCGPSQLNGESGAITSPVLSAHRKGPVECVYLLKRDKNTHLLLHFVDADLGYESRFLGHSLSY